MSDSRLRLLQRHSKEYPTLSRMARDILAVPASSTDSERAFSQAKLFETDRRNRLSASSLEALMVLHSAYASNLVTIEGMVALRAEHSHMKGTLLTAPMDVDDEDSE